MSDAETFYPPDTKLGPETEPPIQYTLPFDWGTFRVSEAAHQAYGFTPLVQGKLEGSSNQCGFALDVPAPRVDIWMLSPDELGDIPIAKDQEEGSVGLGVDRRIGPQGVTLVCGLTKSRVELTQGVRQTFERAAREHLGDEVYDEEEISAEKFVNPSGVPFTETVEQNITQVMMRTVCNELQGSTKHASAEWIKREADQRETSLLTRFGKIGLLGSGSVLTAGTLHSMNTATPIDNIASAAVAFGLFSLTLIDLRQKLGTYLRASRQSGEELDGLSDLLASGVSEGIFQAYSTEYFDRQNADLFDDPSSEDN